VGGDHVGPLVVDDPAPEQVPHVRAQAVHPLLLAVEGQREAPALRDPEVLQEPAAQRVGIRVEAVGERRVLPHLAREPGGPPFGVVDVALDLAGRDRARGDPAVPEQDRVPRVLPALVHQAGLRVARLVLDVAVAVAVAPDVDPLQRGPRVRLELADEIGVAGPALVFLQQHEEERRGIRGPVVRRVGRLAQHGELAVADLVQDLAGLLVAEVVDASSLTVGERRERRARDRGGRAGPGGS
jgi:hypothetical protein